MYTIDYSRPAAVHFIGIGGISMSGLASVLLDRGFTVTGSDRQRSTLTDNLEKAGAAVFYGQRAENIPKDCDAVVYTAAVRPDNPEFAAAAERGLPMLSRAELLGQIMDNYDRSIAVAGTHGKTTTTSMTAHILLEDRIDPTISVGGILPAIGGNIRIGGSDVFVTEACEYTNSFLSLNPLVGVILNVEEDHMDFFKDIDDIRNSFRRFAERVPENGTLVVNAEITDAGSLFEGLACRVVSFSADPGIEAEYTADGIAFDGSGRASFTIVHNGSPEGRFSLKVPGKHNIANALAAAAACRAISISYDTIRAGFESFTGTDRRFQLKGAYKGAVIVDDYAHHPTEIRAALATAANYPHSRIRCIFQPHTYSRTARFLPEFAEALCMADEVILAKIYAAREKDTLGISSKDVADAVNASGTEAVYYETFEEIENYIRDSVRDGDLIITMGAGNVYEIGEELLETEK